MQAAARITKGVQAMPYNSFAGPLSPQDNVMNKPRYQKTSNKRRMAEFEMTTNKEQVPDISETAPRQLQVYLDGFLSLRGRADSLFRELSGREIRQYSSAHAMLATLLTEPTDRLIDMSRSAGRLNEALLKSWGECIATKTNGAEMIKFEYLMYACSSLSLKVDALSRFVGVFGNNRDWLDLATYQDLAINSALKSLGEVVLDRPS